MPKKWKEDLEEELKGVEAKDDQEQLLAEIIKTVVEVARDHEIDLEDEQEVDTFDVDDLDAKLNDLESKGQQQEVLNEVAVKLRALADHHGLSHQDLMRVMGRKVG